MAQIEDPRKQFNFSIFAPGLNPFLAQVVTLPDWELEKVAHGDTNYDVNTAGRPKFSGLMVEKLSIANASDSWVWQWLRDIQDVYVGGGQLPSQYKRIIEVHEYSTDNFTILNRWVFSGCWPQKVNGKEFTRLGSDNTLEKIEFSIDRPRHL